MDRRPSDRSPFDLAIVGAGLNGSLLALAAGETGLSTALVDRVPLSAMTEQGFDGRTTAIAYTSQRLFAALGLWDELAPNAEPIRDIRISDAGHDGRASPLFLHFDHREASDDPETAPPMAGSSRTASFAPRFCAVSPVARKWNSWRPTKSSRASAVQIAPASS